MDTESLLFLSQMTEKMEEVAKSLGTLGGGENSVLEMLRRIKEEGEYGNTQISGTYMTQIASGYNGSGDYAYKYIGNMTIIGEGILDCIVVARLMNNETYVSIKIDGNEKSFSFNRVNSSEYIEDYLPVRIKFNKSLEIKVSNNYESSVKVLYRLKE